MSQLLDPDQEVFRATTRRYLEATSPITATRRLADDTDGFSRPWWKDGAALGWTSFLVGEALGGGTISGAGVADLALVAEEFGRLVAPGPLLGVNVAALALSESAAPERFAAVLAALVDGSTTAAWADEPYAPGSGSTVVARPEGEGLVLDGVAPAVEAGAQADHLVLTAGGPGGRYQVLVPARRAGLSCAPLRSVDVVRRFASVRLDNVVMAPEEILSGPGAAEIALERQRQVAAVLALSEVQGATPCSPSPCGGCSTATPSAAPSPRTRPSSTGRPT